MATDTKVNLAIRIGLMIALIAYAWASNDDYQMAQVAKTVFQK